MGKGTSAVTKESRINDICTMVKKNPGRVISINSIAKEIGVGWNTINSDIQYLIGMDDSFEKRPRGVVYLLKPKKSDPVQHDIFFGSERKGMDKHPITKNESGCPDPTAAALLMKEKMEEAPIEESFPVSSFKIGDIWSVSISSSDKTENVVVLGINKPDERIVCCPYDTRFPRAYMNISTKPTKYFKQKVTGLTCSQKTELHNKLLNFFNIAPKIKEVEKIVEVEKKVEVPVEKIVEVEKPVTDTPSDPTAPRTYNQLEVDVLLSDQKAEIYEKCFNILAGIKR